LETLIIDDESDICYLLSNILKQRNLHTDYVNSLSAAISALQKQNPLLVFLDNHLPDGLGIDFVEHIKKNYPAAKVVMISADDTWQDKKNALNKGVDFFISKPFTKDKINTTVDDFLGLIFP
jgi:two-component system OmpR family response regulator